MQIYFDFKYTWGTTGKSSFIPLGESFPSKIRYLILGINFSSSVGSNPFGFFQIEYFDKYLLILDIRVTAHGLKYRSNHLKWHIDLGVNLVIDNF